MTPGHSGRGRRIPAAVLAAVLVDVAAGRSVVAAATRRGWTDRTIYRAARRDPITRQALDAAITRGRDHRRTPAAPDYAAGHLYAAGATLEQLRYDVQTVYGELLHLERTAQDPGTVDAYHYAAALLSRIMWTAPG